MDDRGTAGWIIFVTACIIAIMFLLASLVSSLAHDHTRPDLNEWFHGLHSTKGNKWCCEGPGRDAFHISDADWETKGGHYRVKIPANVDDYHAALKGETVNTIWVDVPDEAIIEEPNKFGPTVVWPTYGYQGPEVRCFLPGSLT